MNNYNILHITDLHLHDISTSSMEYLRNDYYKTYIGNLVDLLKTNDIKIHFIIITGDIIDRFKKSNFAHAKTILKYLSAELDLGEKSIGLCVGNHDFNRDKDTAGKIKDARKDYSKFVDNYANGYSKIVDGDFFTISKLNDEVVFISLDSTYKRESDSPGILAEEDINKLIIAIELNKINDFESVIFASHYPLTHFPLFPFPEKNNWYDEHFWKSGSFLRVRIEEVLFNTRKVWLFGDTHQPGSWTNNSSTYVMTGRFGTKIEKIDKSSKITYVSSINRQASVIELNNDRIVVNILQHYSLEHKESTLRGKWGLGHKSDSKLKLIRPEVINSKIEADIFSRIIENKLYRFGRFSTNHEYDILGWVFINDLLNSHSLLSSIIQSCKSDWIDKKKIEFDDKSLFIGLDYWGGIIAAHLSVLTNVKNLPLPSKGNLRHYANAELLDQNKSLFNNEYNNITLIIDVLNSGKTLLILIDDLKTILNLSANCKINCISVLSDINQDKDKELKCLNLFGTFCGKLRQPIVAKNSLPPESILPRKEYFTD